MKLSVKLSCITAAIIMAAIAVSGTAICFTRKSEQYSFLKEESILETLSIVNQMNELINDKTDHSDEAYRYYFKTLHNDYCVFYNNNNEIFNHTILNDTELSQLNYSSTSTSNITYAYLKTNGKKYLCYRYFSLSPTLEQQKLYILYSTQDIDKNLQMFFLMVLTIIIVVTILSFLVLYFILQRVFTPLSELSVGAKAISEGAYDNRVSIKGNDEIALLAIEFNQMAEAIQSKINEMKIAEENKNAFMADFSHELKTPLTAIIGYAQTMRTIKLSEEDQADALAYIYTESRRLDQLSKKMLQLFELDHESIDCSQVLSVKTILENAKNTCKPMADDKNIKLIVKAENEKILANGDLLQDAISNLIDNAIKASPLGSDINIYTQNQSIIISDNGYGIPKEEIIKITEPFYRVDKSRSKKNGGVGLGLTLVKKILDKCHITLEIESEINQGTKMILHFDDVSMNT